jgi:hypothetical protein
MEENKLEIFYILTAVLLKILMLFDLTSYRFVFSAGHFEGS